MAIRNDNASVNNDFLLLDDEEDFKLVSTVDTSHTFLNFSRRIAETTSMKRPVDIQLGIACGKDLLFTRHPLQGNSIITTSSFTGPIKLANEIRTSVSSSVKKVAVITNQPNVKRKKKMSLDRLVNDVLGHIESCPGHIAYSDDLVRLKPKLEAYSHSRQTCYKTIK